MPERMEHVCTAARGANYRQAVRSAGPVPHPDLDPVGRQVARQVRECPQRKVAQDGRPPPIRRGIQAGQLDLPGDAQSAAGHRNRHLAVAGHDRVARAGAGRSDDGVIATLGFKAHPVSRCTGEHTGTCARGDHCSIAQYLVVLRRHGRQPAGLNTKPGRPRMHPFGAERSGVAHQRRHIGARICAIAARLDQHAEGVTPVELRLLLAQLILIQFEPLHAVVPAQPPSQSLRLEISAAREDVEQSPTLDQVCDPGLLGQTAMPLGRVGHQRAECAGDRLYLRHR